MSFYITYYQELNERKENNLFYFDNGSLFSQISGKNIEKYELLENEKETYQFILNICENNEINSFEIAINKKIKPSILEYILELYSMFLIENDYSIGIIVNDREFITCNKTLFDSYGLMSSIEKNRPTIFAGFKFKVNRSVKGSISKECASFSGNALNKAPKLKTNKIILEESFHDKLIRLLNESGKTNVEVYTAGGITRQLFSKIISSKDLIPTKGTIVCLIIGMELCFEDAKELLLSAGYALSRSILFDSIIIKYIKNEIYDLDLINDELDENGLPLLGWKPRE